MKNIFSVSKNDLIILLIIFWSENNFAMNHIPSRKFEGPYYIIHVALSGGPWTSIGTNHIVSMISKLIIELEIIHFCIFPMTHPNANPLILWSDDSKSKPFVWLNLTKVIIIDLKTLSRQYRTILIIKIEVRFNYTWMQNLQESAFQLWRKLIG